jgi:hypothetical protein
MTLPLSLTVFSSGKGKDDSKAKDDSGKDKGKDDSGKDSSKDKKDSPGTATYDA